MKIVEHADKFVQEALRRGMAKNTVNQYASCIKSFFAWGNFSHPKNVNEQDIRNYLSAEFDEPNSQRAAHSAIKKYYEIIFHQYNKFKFIPYTKKKSAKPIILSEHEVSQLLQATTNLKHFAITLTLYATGVRISELLDIRLCDIDRSSGVIHIMHGKGAKQRQVPLKPKLLEVIETYYRKFHPEIYLFENDDTHEQYTERSVASFLKANATKAGIKKRVYPHLLRHCFFSHSAEHGENLYVLQSIAGHSDPKITANTYIHGSSRIIANSYSPLSNLNFQQRLPA
jgi:integrase/recombinase XerD